MLRSREVKPKQMAEVPCLHLVRWNIQCPRDTELGRAASLGILATLAKHRFRVATEHRSSPRTSVTVQRAIVVTTFHVSVDRHACKIRGSAACDREE
jgi:hypothetical protein